MKQRIQKLAHRFGYHISRVTPPSPAENAFAEMKRLCEVIAEPVIFDVGAHHGQTARAFRGLFPRSQIYCFEPFPESFRILEVNTAADERVTICSFGLSDRVGEFPFHSNASSATNSLLSTDELGSRNWGKGLLETEVVVRAQFKTIDSVLEEFALPQIDILKLDVQGAEHLVMKGASRACTEGRIRLVYSEIITQPTYLGQKRFDESLSVFYDNGFDLHGIYNLSRTSEGRLRQLDAIFCRGQKGERSRTGSR